MTEEEPTQTFDIIHIMPNVASEPYRFYSSIGIDRSKLRVELMTKLPTLCGLSYDDIKSIRGEKTGFMRIHRHNYRGIIDDGGDESYKWGVPIIYLHEEKTTRKLCQKCAHVAQKYWDVWIITKEEMDNIRSGYIIRYDDDD